MRRKPRSVYRAAERRVGMEARRHARAALHHLHVMTRLDQLERDDVEHSDYYPVYGPENQFDYQLRAVQNEVQSLCRLLGAPDEVVERVERGFADSDKTVAVELNYGSFGVVGIEVYRGNKHQEASESCVLGPGASNSAKRETVDEIIERATDAYGDDYAYMLVFTGGDSLLHVGFRAYDRANEAVLQLAEPSLVDRLLGNV